jgi:hypothetical protein
MLSCLRVSYPRCSFLPATTGANRSGSEGIPAARLFWARSVSACTTREGTSQRARHHTVSVRGWVHVRVEALDCCRVPCAVLRCVRYGVGVGGGRWNGSDHHAGQGRAEGGSTGVVPCLLDGDGGGHQVHGGLALPLGSFFESEDPRRIPQGYEGGNAEVRRSSSQFHPHYGSPDTQCHGEHRGRRSGIRPPSRSRWERQLGFVWIPGREVEGDQLSCPHRRRIVICDRDCAWLKRHKLTSLRRTAGAGQCSSKVFPLP